ncbi:hypothetical protein JVU11DRAFT_10528 [Chiua virens]|nr:hypothetical protein JVU11DRAFT_10528 [Chiua virens]
MLILEATSDASLMNYIKYPWLSNLFKCEDIIIFPLQSIITHFCVSGGSTYHDFFPLVGSLLPEVKNKIVNEILTFTNKDGIIQTYFDMSRP